MKPIFKAILIGIALLILLPSFGFIVMIFAPWSKSNYTPINNKLPYIAPKPFKTGIINPPKRQKIADACENKVMYPINPIYVNYGHPSDNTNPINSAHLTCKTCDINIFNAAP